VVEDVGNFTLKFKVAILSQPPALLKVAVKVPASVQLFPFQLYGNSLAQTEILVVENVGNFSVKFKVARLSHPAALVKLAVKTPASVQLFPFQLYGNSFAQTEILVVENVGNFTLKFKVATLSQPAALVKGTVKVPASVMVFPFQLKGNSLAQTEILVVENVGNFTLKFKLARLSQPAALLKLCVKVPASVMVFPFQL